MKDTISIGRLGKLHPKIQPEVQKFIEDAESALFVTIRISQGTRTFEEQQAIYDQGRKTPGKIVTWSPPGASYHNYGIAIDVVVVNPDGTINWNFDYHKLLPYMGKMTWGGVFPKPDMDHFENKYGLNWRDLLHKYQIKDFIPGTEFVNI